MELRASEMIEAHLALAVGDDAALRQELREAFIASIAQAHDLMGRARCDANWTMAALRLRNIAASFGAASLVTLADQALAGAPSDPAALRAIATVLRQLETAPDL